MSEVERYTVLGSAHMGTFVRASDYDKLAVALKDLLDDMVEDASQRHPRDKYGVYQISPDVVAAAHAALDAKP